MSTEIEFGLTIMAVGMIAVFSILGFVVLGGKIMILLINRFTPEEKHVSPTEFASQSIDNTKISVLVSAVAGATNGQGRITHIKKL